jgi:PIN domain nuclease of toxin-antitoxin system
VLDASALVALLLDEPGKDLVREAVRSGEALMCAANWAEVAGILRRVGFPVREVGRTLDELQIEVAPLDQALALVAGMMEAQTRPLGLSLGDRCCLALAEQERATVLTADRAWLKWKGKAKVVCIR